MRQSIIVGLILGLSFSFSCSIGVLKQPEIDNWLTAISGNAPPAMDISGKWHDARGNFIFGWGEGYLRQEQNKVSGAIGNYNVKGVVSGKLVYLAFIYGGAVYYTARLEMIEDGLLAGNYFKANDKEQSNGYPTSLAKTVETTGTTLVPARLYDLSNADMIQAQFVFSGTTHGSIFFALPSGETFTGEYQTITGGSTEWGNVYGAVWGPYSVSMVSGTRHSTTVPTEYRGSAVATSNQGTVITCEYISNTSSSQPHGQGACKDNRGRVYKLMY